MAEGNGVLIALHRGNNPVQRLIKWQTRGPYAHASLIDTRHSDILHAPIIEMSMRDGAVERRRLVDVEDRVDLYRIDFISMIDADAILRWARDTVARGVKYDWTMIARFLSREKETAGSRTRLFCSEQVFGGAEEGAGVKLLARTQAWEVSPNMLARSPLLTYVGSVKDGLLWFDPALRHGTKTTEELRKQNGEQPVITVHGRAA